MWISRVALKIPYMFVIAAPLLLLITPFVLLPTPTDVLSNIGTLVVSIIWKYTGLAARNIQQRMVYTEERALTRTGNKFEHIKSNSSVAADSTAPKQA